MGQTRVPIQDWARVRFGAGTPWRRCWYVITPPDEKDVAKHQKQLRKKSAYDRAQPVLKGSIRFYETKKTKKATPIATINDAYSAYAIYPQSKPLIDQSTLIKVEGNLTIHSKPEITTEGFLFVMPEVHPAISGFEMLLRFLVPLYDVYGLYGRPNRLVASTIDPRSLMFALPQEERYGYLELLDVSALIHEAGSQAWTEQEWRKNLRNLTQQRMQRMTKDGRPRSRASSYRGYRDSIATRGPALRYEDGASIKSTPSLHQTLRENMAPMPPPHKPDSAPPAEGGPFVPPQQRPTMRGHQRSFSEASPISTPRHNRSKQNGPDHREYTPSRRSPERNGITHHGPPPGRVSFDRPPPPPPVYPEAFPANGQPPVPPKHGMLAGAGAQPQHYVPEVGAGNSRSSSESDRRLGETTSSTPPEFHPAPPPHSVFPPPAFAHEPGAQPKKRPGVSPDLRRANSRLSVTTLSQLAEAGKGSTVGGAAAAGAAAAWRPNSQTSANGSLAEDKGQRGVIQAASTGRNVADRSTSSEGMVTVKSKKPIRPEGVSRNVSTASSQLDNATAPYYKDKPLMSEYDLVTPIPTPTDGPSRTISPLSQVQGAFDSRSPSTGTTGRRKLTKEAPQAIRQNSQPQSNPVAPPANSRPTASRSSTSRSLSRKPVPPRTPTRTSPEREIVPPLPVSKPSIDDFHEQYVDEDALARALERQHTSSLTSQTPGLINDDPANMSEDSDATPDYASTAPRKSTETRRSEKSIERPRRGVLKTVGTVEPEAPKPVQVGDFTYGTQARAEPTISSDIPIVDFDKTLAQEPATATTQPQTSESLDHNKITITHGSERPIPSPKVEQDTTRRVAEPPATNVPKTHERITSRNLVTPEPQIRPGSSSSESDNRRSLVWQPGATIGGGSPSGRPSLTPEQFVQQRASANRITPIYAHAQKRSESHTPPISGHRATGSTPPTMSRNTSGDLSALRRHSPSPGLNQKRMSSYSQDLPPRPSSRSTNMMINPSGDYSAHLSAREQEHVARATGSPVNTMAANPNTRVTPSGAGLVGAIEAREKEKREIKEGVSGQMVQHAIAQRQQHERGHQSRQASYTLPQPSYSMPGGFPPSPIQGNSAQPSPVQQQPPYGWGPPVPPQQFQPPVQQQQQQQYFQPQYQQGQQSPQQPHWTPPSAGTIYGGAQQGQQQYPPQQQGHPHQYAPQHQQGYYGGAQYQQGGGYGP